MIIIRVYWNKSKIICFCIYFLKKYHVDKFVFIIIILLLLQLIFFYVFRQNNEIVLFFRVCVYVCTSFFFVSLK